MKHFKNFEQFLSDNTIYHTIHEGKNAFIMGNTLYYDNETTILPYTPVYESNTKHFVLLTEETTLSDIGNSFMSGDVGGFFGNAGSWLKEAAWNQIKFPTNGYDNFEGLMEWGHWATGNTSLLIMLVGLILSVFTAGGSILAGVTVAKIIDIFDISLYVIETAKYLGDGDTMKGCISLVIACISSILIFTTPEGNSAFLSNLSKLLKKATGSFRPKTVQEGVEYLLENETVKKKIGGKVFKELGSSLKDVMSRTAPALQQLGNFLSKTSVKFLNLLGGYILKLWEMCKKALEKINGVFTNTVVPKNLFKEYPIISSIFGGEKNSGEYIRKLGDIVNTPDAQRKLGNVFNNIHKKIGNKKILNNASFLSPEKLGAFAKNIEHMDDVMLNELSDVFTSKEMLSKIGDFTTSELGMLSKHSKNRELLKLIGGEVDIPKAKKYLQWSQHISNPNSLVQLEKIDPKILDALVKNGGNSVELLTTPIYTNFGRGTQAKIQSALYNNIQKGVDVRYNRVDLNNFNNSVVEFAEKVYAKEGRIIFDGKIFLSFDAFKKYAISDKYIGGATKFFDVFTRVTSAESIKKLAYGEKNDQITKAVCPPGNNTTMIVEHQNITPEEATEYIFKPVSERTDEDRNLTQEYLKYISESSKLTTPDYFAKTLASDPSLPKSLTDYDLENGNNYINVAKLFQAYINMNYDKGERLIVDGKIGPKTLTKAYEFFTAKNNKGEIIGEERATATMDLINKLKQ
jgi:hypothetical protein